MRRNQKELLYNHLRHKALPKLPAISAIFLSMLLCAPVNAWAMGLEINPGRIVLRGVPLGRRVAASEVAVGPPYLEITNKGRSTYDYVINILKTSETSAPLPSGYADIPDTSWIIPEQEVVSIQAGQTKKVELYISVPDDLAYADKGYQAVIEVETKPSHPQDIFVLAAQMQITFTTKPDTE